MANTIKLTIKGKLLSKSNSRVFTSFGGRPRLLKSPRANQYVETAMWQLKSQLRGHTTFESPVRMDIVVYYENKRPDLDVSLIQDILEKTGVYKNDRLVYEIHAYKLFDKVNPRLVVLISELDDGVPQVPVDLVDAYEHDS